jgi:hypothetical protein
MATQVWMFHHLWSTVNMLNEHQYVDFKFWGREKKVC